MKTRYEPLRLSRHALIHLGDPPTQIIDERGRHHTRTDDTTTIRRRADACDIVALAVDIPDGLAGRLVTRSIYFTHTMPGPTAVEVFSPG